MTASSDLQPDGGFQLPREAYYCESWFEREWHDVFESGWIFVGVIQEIPDPGTFKTIQVGKYPVILTRDLNSELHAFHNVCRHRGCLVATGNGKRKSLTCPYHAWNYGLDGKLKRIPMKEDFYAFDKSDYGLKPLAIDTFWGMIYVNLNPDAESLESWLQGFPEAIHEKGVRPEELSLLHYREYEAGSNWKFIVENQVDCLHVAFLHGGSSNWKFDDLHYEYCGPHHLSHYPYDFSPEGMGLIPNMKWTYPAFTSNVIFPNVFTYIWQSVCAFMHILPISAEKTIWRWFVLGTEGSDPTEYLKFYENVVLEDIEASDWLQSAVKSPVFDVGPMARSFEKPVAVFHKDYTSMLPIAGPSVGPTLV